jgi:hypothetical protein
MFRLFTASAFHGGNSKPLGTRCRVTSKPLCSVVRFVVLPRSRSRPCARNSALVWKRSMHFLPAVLVPTSGRGAVGHIYQVGWMAAGCDNRDFARWIRRLGKPSPSACAASRLHVFVLLSRKVLPQCANFPEAPDCGCPQPQRPRAIRTLARTARFTPRWAMCAKTTVRAVSSATSSRSRLS